MDLGYILRRQIWLKSISSPYGCSFSSIEQRPTIFAFNDLVLGMLHGRVRVWAYTGL
jgi:hypothetical protein